MKLNGQPIDVMQPECMRMKAIERFANLDIRITVKGGGRIAQIYGEFFVERCDGLAIRQAISRAIVAFYQKCRRLVYWCVMRRRG